MRSIQPAIIGLLFVTAGALHFAKPKMYESIMPPYLPAHHELVLASGAFEILGGIGVLLPATRRFSAWGLIALLLAVFPANVYMASDPKFAEIAPRWVLLGRLPLQFALIAWIYTTCVRPLSR